MVRTITILVLLFLWAVPLSLKAQAKTLPLAEQWLLSELSLNYYTVVQEGLVDQDSSLIRACKFNGLSRWSVITEGFNWRLPIQYQEWVRSESPQTAIKLLDGLEAENHLKLAMLLGAYYTFGAGRQKSDLQQAQYYLSMAERESLNIGSWFWLGHTRCVLGKLYFKMGEVKKGTALYAALIADAEKRGDKKLLAKAWSYQGSYIPPSAETIGLKLNSIINSSEVYKQIKDIPGQINALQNMGYLYFVIKDFGKSESSALESLNLQKSIGFKYTHYTTDFLALLADFKGNLTINLRYALSTIKSAEDIRDSLGLGFFYKRIGDSRMIYKDRASRAEWYRKGLEQLKRNDEKTAVYPLVNSLAFEMVEEGKGSQALSLTKSYIRSIPPRSLQDSMLAMQTLAESYYTMRNYKEAEMYLLAVEKLGKRIKNIASDRFRTYNDFRLGHFYMLTKRYAKAKFYLERFKASSDNSPLLLSGNAAIYMYKVDSALKNNEAAIGHLKEFLAINSKMHDQSQTRIVEDLRVQYQTAQKEMDIKLLKQETEIEKKQSFLIKFVALTVISMAIIIILLLFRQYRVKKSQNEEIDRKNQLLEHIITEKDELIRSKQWLLKEVHHRVKNNLHTVISLLESQAHYLKGDALKAIQNSEHRIYAMSLIHQKLYQEDDVKTIEIASYLSEFISYLKESFQSYKHIVYRVEVEPMRFGVSRAIPIGLIVNEAVTNSIKYAFPDMEQGTVLVRLTSSANQITLVIKDDGIGIDPAAIKKHSASLGLRLIKGLADDLGGIVKFTGNRGTEIKIVFNSVHTDIAQI